MADHTKWANAKHFRGAIDPTVTKRIEALEEHDRMKEAFSNAEFAS
jgi:hypothetical protein